MDLKIEDLKVELAKKEIVKGISLMAEKKSFVGLLGPNGSGKSTLLRAVYQAIKPSHGTVLMDGIPMGTLSPKKISKKMAVVGQFNHIDFDFKVIEIALMGRTPHKNMLEMETKEDYFMAEDALKKVGMEHYADRSFASLSGGEKQRIVLARALAQSPEILILDEPTNHLDIKYQLQILSVIKGLNICVLSALHDLSLASQYCDSIYILKDGLIAGHGKPEEIITPEMVYEVYGVKCDISRNPRTNMLSVSYYQD